MQVYLATSGEYSDFHVDQVFANEKDAEEYASKKSYGFVLPYVVQEGPVDSRPWYYLHWSPFLQREEDPRVYSDYRDFDGRDRYVEHSWNDNFLRVEGWDKERVLKVFSEQRAEFLAEKEGIS